MSNPAAITIQHLYFSYQKKEIFHDLTLSFPMGQRSAIMAKSGYGKTTLLFLICGLLPISKGSIHYFKKKPTFSFVFQENRLVEKASISSNLRMIHPKLTNQEICKYLSDIEISKEYLHKPIEQLSGGEQRRIAILRALIANYDILLLDEPFTGLDTGTKANMIEYIRMHTIGKTILLVTHEEEEALSLCAKSIFQL